MKEKLLFVCERRDTILAIESELTKTEMNTIEKIFINNVLYFNRNKSEELIETCKNFDSIIIDQDIKILDHLLLNSKDKIIVQSFTKNYTYNCLSGLQVCLDNNKIEFSKNVNVKINDYTPKSSNPLYTKNDIEHLTYNDKLLIDIELFVNRIKNSSSLYYKNKILNRYIYERNLKQILELLKEDFNEIDILNAEQVNEVLRLMDKVNYLRGQYK